MAVTKKQELCGLLNVAIEFAKEFGLPGVTASYIFNRFYPNPPTGNNRLLTKRLLDKRRAKLNRHNIVTEYGEILAISDNRKPVLVEYAIEEHVTPRNQTKDMTPDEIRKLKSGDKGVRTHWDLRWRDPKTGEVHAVAIPQSRLPEEGDRFQVQKVDDRHGHKALINTGTKIKDNHVLIEEGYGRGHSKVLQTGKTFVWTSEEGNLHIWIPGKGPFALVQPDNWDSERSYLMIKIKEQKNLNTPRPFDTKDISSRPDKFQEYIDNPSYIEEEKFDGAFYTVTVSKQKGKDYAKVKVISRRAKHVDGEPTTEGIDRSYNMLHLKYADWPEEAYDKPIHVEIYSDTAGEYPSKFNRAAALLNSDPALSLEKQAKSGKLKVAITGISEVGDYDSQRKLAEKIASKTKYEGETILSVPRIARTREEKLALTKTLKKEGAEGAVFKKADEEVTVLPKYIFRGETKDVRIVGVKMMETSQSKYMNGNKVAAAQIFEVIDDNGNIQNIVIRDPSGKPGDTDKLRLEVGQNPDKYIGLYLEVRPNRSDRASASQIVRIREDK